VRIGYIRTGENVLFLLPTAAVGVDVDGLFFFEIAWLCWAIGVGVRPE